MTAAWQSGAVPFVRLLADDEAAGASTPLPVTVGRTAVITAGALVVSTIAYSVGDVVGTKVTLAGAARSIGKGGLLQQVSLFSKVTITAAMDLLVFHTDPTASTFTDNAALAVAVADFDKLVGVVHLSDWTSIGTPNYAQADNLAKPFQPAAGSVDLYAVLVTRAAMTLGSTSDLKLICKFIQD